MAHYEHVLQTKGIEVTPGVWKQGQEGIDALREMYVVSLSVSTITFILALSSGLPLSTYFSATKVRWMIDNYPEVAQAHANDDMCFGTLESWLVYVCSHSLSMFPNT